MKAQILKISGHKNEKDFYKEFPTMESFMAKHGAAFKKAQSGFTTDIDRNGVPDYLEYSGNQQMGPVNRFPKPSIPQDTSLYDPSSVIQPYQKTATDVMNEGLKITDAASKTADTASVDNTGAYIQAAIQAGTAIAEGIPAVKSQRKKVKQSRAMADASDVVKKAFFSTDVDARNVYADNAKRVRNALQPVVSGNEFFPSYGVGTNVLGQAQSGGEIANTFAPGTLYDDLGYEPLGESVYQPLTDQEIVKAYKSGGLMRAQQGGYLNSDHFKRNASSYQTLLNTGSTIMDNIGEGPDAGTGIGGGIGSALGTAVGSYFGGPVGGAVLGAAGKFVGGAIGGVIDQSDTKIKKANKRFQANLSEMTNINNLRNSYGTYTKNGGNINPQELKYFGEHSVKSLFKPDPMMETLRTGGNIRQNSVGDINALSGGSLEPISYNPYSDGNGITSMIKGQTHEESNGRHTGVLLNYNQAQNGMSMEADVEAENNEPVTEIGDSAVIFGDQVINKTTVGNDPMFKGMYGKTFKKAMAGIAEQNQKLNKQQAKNTKALNSLDVRTPIDKLTLNSLTMNAKAIDTKYAVNDAMMKKAAAYQEVVNNEAQRLGINSGDFSRGKLSTNELSSAQNGKSVKSTSAMQNFPKGQHKGDTFYGKVTQADFDALKRENPWFDWKTFDPKKETDVLRFQNDFNKMSEAVGSKARINPDGQFGEQTASARIETDEPGAVVNTSKKIDTPKDTLPDTLPDTKDHNYGVTPYKKAGWETAIGQILPWLRRQPGEDLQGDQVLGEMLALTDKEEPVQARYYHPNLRTPYDVSYQDQLNANQADFNQLVRASGNNPEALSALAAQKYGANSKVLAEQFRANQAMKEGVYSQNTGILNDALMKNLQIADQQYVRQATAKSATKALKQEALNSIASKLAQNRLENRTLQTYANMFPDYSYDKNFRIRKTGAPVDWNISQGVYQTKDAPIDRVPIYDSKGEIVGYQAVETKEARHGSLIKAFKNL